ncbi:LRR domain containing protein [Trema orientale]|uniref:LRR domain containing protein n=1 Tax=Trema orientale TaxID=63057 RepID=A0A2P5DUY9_TREOI|nr:LRR domain containing protein [Trema orientale]
MESLLCPLAFMRLSFTLTMLFLNLIPMITFLSTTSADQPLCHNHERIALLQFKDSFVIDCKCAPIYGWSYPKAASWIAKGINASDCCSWDGVSCDENTGHVTALDLDSSCLCGSINSTISLFRLSQLRSLNLAYNHFNNSQIPSGLGQLSRLEYLNLSNSFFSGQVPYDISMLSSLSSLDLSEWYYVPETELEGLKIPSLTTILGNLSSLKQLHLSYVHIPSHVPSFLANFSLLTSLRMDGCGLFGEFPPSIFQLPNLQVLSLAKNQHLSGQLPEFRFGSSTLEVLYLSGSSFSGDITFSFCKLSRLRFLGLSENKFSGHISSCLRNLTQLTVLDFHSNQLTGEIPSSIANLTRLNGLVLSSNILHGAVPHSISRLNRLRVLYLQWNQLSGTVDINMFTRLKYLFKLQLSFNHLSLLTKTSNINTTVSKFELLGLISCNLSSFPDFLRYQDKLEILFLGRNHIHGKIPNWMLNTSVNTISTLDLSRNFLTGFEQLPIVLPWVSIDFLDLSHNKIRGSLPIPPPSIIRYDASDNEFSGEVSPLFCNLTSFWYLDLSNNKLSGSVPECFKNLSNSLSFLNMSYNNFHGRIPEIWFKGSKLSMLDLSNNQFQSRLPRSLKNCFMLQVLNLGNNRLDDIFPPWLGTLPELRVLILRSNNLHGVIKKQDLHSKFRNLRIIDLSDNSFSGFLPSEYFDEWNAMKATSPSKSSYMEGNAIFNPEGTRWNFSYVYSITITIKGVELLYGKIQKAFVVIDLSSNKFEGEIPSCLGSLKGLQALNLSNNFLTGGIPSSFGDIVQLESLDLSQNKLSGRIPQRLQQLTFLAFFDVSHNQLAGPIPRGDQFETFESSSYEDNLGLCGDPLPKKCEDSENTMPATPSSLEEEQDSGSRVRFDWITVVPGFVGGLVLGVVFEHTLATRKHGYHFVKSLFWRARKPNGRRDRRGFRI